MSEQKKAALTPEQEYAAWKAAFDAPGTIMYELPRSTIHAIFLAGLREGRVEMREQAAKVCESVPMDQMDCAAAIRDLPDYPI